MSDRWIVIPRWDEFQHPDVTRSSVPPWIKTYTKLLSDDDYLNLTVAQRGILHGLWMAFATHRKVVQESLVRRLLCSCEADNRHWTRNVEALNHAGFIVFSASKPASNLASNLASLEVDREKKVLSAKARKPVDNSQPQRANVLPKDPAQAIRTMIANGVITDPVDLEAEIAGAHLNHNVGDDLRKLLQ